MDEEIVKQILDELFSFFESSETQSAALLLFLKDQGVTTEEKLAPYVKQAATTSEVRWRAARVRMGALLASALKDPEPASEKKITAAQEKKAEATSDADANEAKSQTAESRSEAPKKPAESATHAGDAAEDAEKNQDRKNEGRTTPAK
jgi:hypothetical protein